MDNATIIITYLSATLALSFVVIVLADLIISFNFPGSSSRWRSLPNLSASFDDDIIELANAATQWLVGGGRPPADTAVTHEMNVHDVSVGSNWRWAASRRRR